MAFNVQLQVGVLLQKFHNLTQNIRRPRLNRRFSGIKLNAIDCYVAGLVQLVRKTGSIGGHLLLHLFFCNDHLVVEGSFVVEVVPCFPLVRGNLAR